MPNINDTHSIIVSADAPIFSAHTYTEIYGGSAGCNLRINIVVNTISGGTGCYLLGDNNNVFNGSTGIGGIY